MKHLTDDLSLTLILNLKSLLYRYLNTVFFFSITITVHLYLSNHYNLVRCHFSRWFSMKVVKPLLFSFLIKLSVIKKSHA